MNIILSLLENEARMVEIYTHLSGMSKITTCQQSQNKNTLSARENILQSFPCSRLRNRILLPNMSAKSSHETTNMLVPMQGQKKLKKNPAKCNLFIPWSETTGASKAKQHWRKPEKPASKRQTENTIYASSFHWNQSLLIVNSRN